MPLHPCVDACRMADMEVRMKVLEKEHGEFFNRWHSARMEYEALQRAVESVRPTNWHEDIDWVQLTETFSLTPNQS